MTKHEFERIQVVPNTRKKQVLIMPVQLDIKTITIKSRLIVKKRGLSQRSPHFIHTPKIALRYYSIHMPISQYTHTQRSSHFQYDGITYSA